MAIGLELISALGQNLRLLLLIPVVQLTFASVKYAADVAGQKITRSGDIQAPAFA